MVNKKYIYPLIQSNVQRTMRKIDGTSSMKKRNKKRNKKDVDRSKIHISRYSNCDAKKKKRRTK